MLSGLLADHFSCGSHAETFLQPGPSSFSLRPRLSADEGDWLVPKSIKGGSCSSWCGSPVPAMIGAPPLHSRGLKSATLSSFLTVDLHRPAASTFLRAEEGKKDPLQEMEDAFKDPPPPKPKPKLCYYYPGENPDDETKRPPPPDDSIHKVKTFPEKEHKQMMHRLKRYLQFFLLGIPTGFAAYGTYLLLKKYVTIPSLDDMKKMIEEAKEKAKKAKEAAKNKGKKGSDSGGGSEAGGGTGSGDAASRASSA